jgi:hypothetical protein
MGIVEQWNNGANAFYTPYSITPLSRSFVIPFFYNSRIQFFSTVERVPFV